MPIFVIMCGKFNKIKTQNTHIRKQKHQVNPPNKQTNKTPKIKSNNSKQQQNKTKNKQQTHTTFVYEFSVRLP